jgi:hypothetical protein
MSTTNQTPQHSTNKYIGTSIMKKGSTRGTSAGNSGPNTANSTNLEVKKERSGTQNSSRAMSESEKEGKN